jgi:hypothetical protein
MLLPRRKGAGRRRSLAARELLLTKKRSNEVGRGKISKPSGAGHGQVSVGDGAAAERRRRRRGTRAC